MKKLVILSVLMTLFAAPSFLQAAQTCDRQCLVNIIRLPGSPVCSRIPNNPTALPRNSQNNRIVSGTDSKKSE